MNHSDDQRPKTEMQPVRMFIGFSAGVKMPVGMRPGAGVNMRMSMEMKVVFSDVTQHPDAEYHEHHCDGKFEGLSYSMRNLEFEKNDEASTEG